MVARASRYRRGKPALVSILTVLVILAFGAGMQTASGAPGTLIDAGFESGADGAALAMPPWIASGVTQRAEYDDAQVKSGTLSGWIRGPATAAYGGVGEADSAGMTSSGAEVRFWAYFDTTNQYRTLDDGVGAVGDRTFAVRFSNTGQVQVYTNRAGNPNGYTTNGYTSVGAYTTGWAEYRMVFDFSSQTYTLSVRANAADPWTGLKAAGATGYGIPFRGVNTVTTTHGMYFRCYQNANLWLDDVKYADGGITDPDLTPPAAPTGLSGTGSTSSASLSWTANTEPDLAGYNVYRDGAKINATLVAVAAYTDDGLAAGTYSYRVTAVDAAGNESAQSAPVGVFVGDQPPAAPTGLSATGGETDVSLSWTANTEPDLAGYNVYRDGAKINATLVAVAAYTDDGLAAGTYSYRVTAVDAAGNESAQSAPVGVRVGPPPATGTLIDAGFESGADGAALAMPPWIASGVTQRAEYDDAQVKSGTLSGWVRGPATAAYGGIGEADSAGMTSSGAEVRFWAYFDTTNQYRTLDDGVGAVVDRTFAVRFSNTGQVQVYTNRAGNPNGYTTNGYTSVGAYTTGWAEYRMVFDFSSQTYTLSVRANAADPWTGLKAAGATGYGIPFRGVNTVTTTHGMYFRCYQNANLWLDDVKYADGGISDPAAWHTVTASAGVGGTITPSGPQSVADGADSPLFVIAADAGYTISDVLVDGVSAGALSSYQFVGVTSDHTIAASFALSGADMPLSGFDCDTCHGAHGDPPPCYACHHFPDYHPGATASALHVPAVITGCDDCHEPSLTVEHNGRTPAGGGTFTCATCHSSADPLVRAAITAGISACTACHPTAGHVSDHDSAVAAVPLGATGFVCGDCHEANLQPEHAKTTSSSSGAGCDACHPMPRDSLTPWAKTCVEGGCHVVASPSAMHGGETTAHTLTPTNLPACIAAGCHDLSAMTVFQGESVADIHSAASTGTLPPRGTRIDAGFESGADGAALAMPPWIASGVTQRAEYDDAQVKSGTLSGWVRGPATAAYGGVGEADSAGMTSSGAEVRFWAYFDTTNQYRTLDDGVGAVVDRTFAVRFSNTGQVQVYTNRAGNPNGYTTNGYTSVGAYTTGWAEYRMVFDFSSQTYTLSVRANAADPWTGLKAAGATGYGIPFRGVNTVTTTHGMYFRCYQNANLWLDDVKYADGGISDEPGTYRESCMICHAAGLTPSLACGTCHPDRALPHGYTPEDHTASGTCVASCHNAAGLTDLKPVHDAAAGAPVTCALCHPTPVNDIKPWDLTCQACHEVAGSHPGAASSHVGNDITGFYTSTYGRSPNGSCSDQAGYYTGCHDISNVATLHSGMADSGCSVCHGAGKTPSASCFGCHGGESGPNQWFKPYPSFPYDANAATLGAPGWYHHNNYKYLENPADQTERPYFFYAGGNYHTQVWPAGGYQNGLLDQECYEKCHQNSWGSGTPWTTPYEGSYMWYSLPVSDSYPDYSVPSRNMTRSITVPAGQTTTLSFKVNWYLEYWLQVWDPEIGDVEYVLQGSDAAEVQVSTDGGATFTALAGTMGGQPNPVSGNSMGWTDATFDLTPYAGQTIQVRFLYVPDPGGLYGVGSYDQVSWSSGWAVDNITVTGSTSGVIFSDGCETVDPGWIDAGWAKNWYRATKAW